MFFPWLKLLKASKEFTDTDISAFDETLARIYQLGYFNRFNARVYKYFGITLDEDRWIQALDQLTESDLLRKNFELCHPVEGNTVRLFKHMSDIPLGETITLDEEEDELYVSENDVYITYSFSDNFKPVSNRAMETLEPKKPSEGTYYTYPQKEIGHNISLAEEMRLYPERVLDIAVSENIDRLKNWLQIIEHHNAEEKTQKGKGDLLEALCKALLSSPYCKLHKQNIRTKTAELDLVFRIKRIQETLFGSFSDLLIVECKNWSAKMSAKEVRSLSTKMEEVKSQTGIILSKRGITGKDDASDARGVVRDCWREKGQIIMVLDLEDVSAVIRNSNGLYSLLEKRFHDVRLM
jgi:hypothetical protein